MSNASLDAGAKAADSRRAIAQLRGLKGTITLERDGASRPATEEALFAKDAISTGADSEAQLVFGDGRTLEIGPDARLVLQEDQTGLLVEVQQGLVLSRVPRSAAAGQGTASAGVPGREPSVSIRILTPFGLTRVGAGESEVAVSVADDTARVEVKIGEVQWVAKSGDTTTAHAGDALSAKDGRVQFVLEPIKVTILADGRAEVRKAGTKSWKAVGRNGAAVTDGDAVRTRKGRSTLRLADSTSVFNLERGAELVFVKSGRSGGFEESHVELQRGELGLALARDRKSRVVVGGLELQSDLGGFFDVVRTKNGFEVSSLAGDLTVKHGGNAQTISAGQTARVSDAESASATVQKEELPDLMLPSRFGMKVFHPGMERALIEWKAGDGDYRVRVAADPRFSKVVAEGIVHQNRLAVPIPRRGALYWEIHDAKTDAEIDSGSALFAPEPKLNELERVRNEVPEGPETTTIYYQDKPPAVTFTFAAEASAAKYRVAVFRQGELQKPIAERTVSDIRAPLEAGALAEGSYLWSVTPLASDGQALRGGRMNKLELVYDNSVPTLLIQSPKNGERALGAVRTRGVAPVGTKLFVNGKPVDLDSKNRFDLTVPHLGRPPMLIYRLVRPNASDAFFVRALRRGRG